MFRAKNSSRSVSCVAILALVVYSACLCIATEAFCTKQDFSLSRLVAERKTTLTKVRSNNAEDAFDAAELTSTLARLDQQWSIQQRVSKQKPRWTKLVIPKDDDNNENEDSSSDEEKPMDSVRGMLKEDFVYLLEPPNNNIPSCLITFVGGAGLGQFPHIAYSEFLTRVSDRLNAAVIAAPYQVGLDHFALSKQTGERIRKAILLCEDDTSRLYPPSLPTYSLGHSLGCKLQTIYLAATGQQYEGMGFISFNNFGFAQTISMARTFATQIRGQFRKGASSTFERGGEDVLETIFGLAENVLGVVGLDFSPNAANTEKLIEMKFDSTLQSKTRLFVFDDDDLDCSRQFLDCCLGSQMPPIASGLPGTHLTPVFLKLGLDNVPEEAKEMTREALGGFESASFGDEENVDQLVQEVCDWILGKGPSREAWQKEDVPRIAGNISTASTDE